eukprot:CAMPEP_0195095188 /NCGR_PEP_ID=MMETSP0448-20130528/46700_1 /TAXON_ID=66468 /ORGANISM="Heterocapsa triquestra, Strain CCMP 448" /LENGTH=113 /DNA_ID=CAMNT_0040129355 /DNA_START=39 /DNA_END=377 /DNA_ORIENTATION=-
MAMSSEMFGVFLMAMTGLMMTLELVTSKVIQSMDWPYWYMYSGSMVLFAVVVAVALYFNGTKMPKQQDIKWVLSRSLCGVMQWTLSVLAVTIGASPGDVAALTSVNIIAAALL